MGQRLQAYLKINNPVVRLEQKLKRLTDAHPKSHLKEKEIASTQISEFKKAFGTEKTTILAFYHQWCYGRAALLSAANILTFNKQAVDANNPFHHDTPYQGMELLRVITFILSTLNSSLAKKLGRYGIEDFELLNFSNPEIREDFRLMDNNDGIFIIDTTTNKYAFVNVGTGDSTISQVKPLQPISANRYLTLYYPECPADSKTAIIRGTTKEEIKAAYENNKSTNHQYAELFNDFEVLTMDELKGLFPKCFNGKNKKPNS